MNDSADEALAALGLPADAGLRMSRYVEMLLEHNARVNLTAARTPEAIVEHLRDALALQRFVRDPLVDIGSGGGFPAIPLAIVTGIAVTLVEATLKKAHFLEAVLRDLGLAGEVVAERAESAAHRPELRERFASATARAVASAPAVAELTLPFLAIGGVAILQRGAVGYTERTAAQDAAFVLGGGLLEEFELERGRLLVIVKRRPTPSQFPRRPGLPERRPLGVSPEERPLRGVAEGAG